MAKPNARDAIKEQIDSIQQLDDLRKSHERTLRALDKAKNGKQEYVEAMQRAVHDAIAGLTIPKVPKPRAAKQAKGDEEVAVPLVSDLQLAKVTPDYNSDVCEQRMVEYAEKIIDLTNLQRADHPVKRAHVAVLGDIIEGVDIFPGQAWLLDAGLYRQIMVDGPRIMISFFRTLLTCFDEIEVTWVIGNHGRIGRKGIFDPETNGDRMLGRLIADLMAGEPRISFNVPDGKGERNWYAILEVGKWKALCIHGDQIKGGFAGFPFYGLGKKVNGWASGSIPEEFQDVLMGHWHQIASIPLNKRNVFVNGSTESYNTFAQEVLAAMSDPAQWLLFVHPENGKVTAEYKVWL